MLPKPTVQFCLLHLHFSDTSFTPSQMGCQASSATGLAAPDSRKSGLSARIKECILLKKREHDNDPHPVTLEKIVLKMEKCKMVLGTIKLVFNQHSTDGGKSITKEALNKVMGRLHSDLTEEDVSQLFDFIDLDLSKSIDFKEFLVSLSVCMVLGKLTAKGLASETNTTSSTSSSAATAASPPDTSSSALAVYRTECIDMLNLILSAYLIFDPEGKGAIRRDQVEKILDEHTSRSVRRSGKDGPAGGAHFFVSAATWDKMDWNHDGEIDFGEFVFAFTSWIDVEELIE